MIETAEKENIFISYPPLGQITSLKIIKESRIILFGVGPYLCQCGLDYEEKGNSNGKSYFKVFDDHTRIHKIQLLKNSSHPDEMVLLLSGGKRIAILSFIINAGALYDVKIIRSKIFCDWIRDVKYVLYPSAQITSSDFHVAVMFSQNFVQLWNLDQNELKESIHCEEKCMLYSGTIFGSNWDHIQFVSGTIFNQALFWNSKSKSSVQKRLVGHEGVLFGIEFDDSGDQVCTVSDDRTIRVWNLLDNEKDPIIIRGHEGRIWSAKFISTDLIVSISEDSTCRLWEISSKSCIACWDGHGGKHIWSFDVCKDLNIVATGGGDGGIRIWNLKDLNQKKESISDDFIVLPLGKDEKKAKYVAIISNHKVASLGCQGCITVYDWERKSSKLLLYDKDLAGYGQLIVSRDGTLMVAADSIGNLTLISTDLIFKSYKWKEIEGKFLSIHLADGRNRNHYHLFGISAKSGKLSWTQIFINDTDIEKKKSVDICLPSDILISDISYFEKDGILAVGSRKGALCIYNVDINDTPKLVSVYRRLHGSDTLTCINISKDSNSSWEICTTGRDGYFVKLLLEKTSNIGVQSHLQFCDPCWRLSMTSRARQTKGYLEKIQKVGDTILLCGSFDFKLFIINESKNFEALAISTGGPASSRIWDFQTKSNFLDEYMITFIKNGIAYASKRNQQNSINFKPFDSYHSQETRAVTFVPFTNLPYNCQILVSGGEDEVLTFHLLHPDNPSALIKITSNRTHSASIRSLCHSSLPSKDLQKIDESSNDQLAYLFSAGSEQNLIAWKLRPKIKCNVIIGISCVPIAFAPQTSAIYENRIMDVSSISKNQQEFIVATANSDCNIRLWLFQEATEHSVPIFKLLQENTKHQRCVQKSQLVLFHDCVYLFTAATDGVLIMWGIESEALKMNYMASWKIHQSGVKGIHILPNEESILVASGGDDNAVSFLNITPRDVAASSMLKLASAHGSSVVGCQILSPTNFISVSIDQRINFYQVSKEKIVLHGAQMIDIADPSDLTFLQTAKESYLAICGHGLQLFQK